VGLDFGTESVRALIVDIRNGRTVAQATTPYDHGVISRELPEHQGHTPLPPDYALQHPFDWLNSLRDACRGAVKAGKVSPEEVVGIGVDFTSCTVLPTFADGMPLCVDPRFGHIPVAWPKLWKHHGAKVETDRINQVARERAESWLARYGGVIGLEWFFPKVLETLNRAPEVYDATEVWLEAGDWLVWQLTSGPFPRCRPGHLIRSTCQAGYKAMWNARTGYPSRAFFSAVDPRLGGVVEQKMPGEHRSPGQRAGVLTEDAANLLGLVPGIPVSAAIIDAHAGVPGSGVAEASTLVMVMGTSACHMMNSNVEQFIPGVAGVVQGGILPDFFGYETGQASVGDAFAWVAKTLKLTHKTLNQRAAKLPPGSGGVMALDWLNGCRTPLMDGRLSGAFIGITLGTRPEQLYRAMLEGTAFGLKWIVDLLTHSGVPVELVVASGGVPAKSPLFMQICADMLDAEIRLAENPESVALGAAILGCLAAGQEATGYASMAEAIRAMARIREDLVYRPDAVAHERYMALYPTYRDLAAAGGPVADAMRVLREGSGA
jgi:L-ribulokinase